MREKTLKLKFEATFPLSDQQLPTTTSKKACSDCSACGKCSKKENTHLNHAGEALLNLAGGAYTLDQLGTALEIIETLLEQYYSKENKN